MTERVQSLWGWGWEDRFPAREQRIVLGRMMESVLGIEARVPVDPPALAGLILPPSRLTVPGPLASFCTTSLLERASHSYGKSFPDLVRGLQGDYARAPDLVARPTSEAQIQHVMAWCDQEQVALIPFGGGTSVVGGVEPDLGSDERAVVSLDVRGLNRVLEVDETSRAARIQAGATGPQLNEQLGVHGLQLRHFPQSYEFSTLGGWIATRAGGHYATLHTHIDDFVESARMLTPRGLWQSLRVPASGAGVSPDRMVLGSEGTLGVITEAWMRVQSAPSYRADAVIHFGEFSAGVEASRLLAQSGLYPSNCRLLDGAEAALNQVSTQRAPVLFLGFESSSHDQKPWMQRAMAICERAGGSCPDGARYRDPADPKGRGSAGTGSWRHAFMEAPYLRNSLVSLGLIVDTFETACSWSQFATLHADIQQSMGEAMRLVCGQGLLTTRFTHVYSDGPAVYYTLIAPSTPGAVLEQWAQLKARAGDTLLRHGATITHHHAVGRMHRPWYAQQRPELFAEVLRAAKRCVDPQGILNPGVLIDPLG